MSPASREKIKGSGKKSLEELRKRERLCPYWVKETVIDVWHPEKTKKEVSMCMATGRNICLRDYKNYNNCEYYLQFKKSEAENTGLGMTMPRYPLNLDEKDNF